MSGRNPMSLDFNPSLAEELVAAATIGLAILFSPITRRWYSSRGSTPDERRLLFIREAGESGSGVYHLGQVA